jgi:hypothetical protein
MTLATVSGVDADPASLLRDRATVYLQIPEARLGDLRPFLRLMRTSFIQRLTSASDTMGANHPSLLFILDESGGTPFADLPDLLVTMSRIYTLYLDEFVQRFRGYSSTDSNLKSSIRSNGFRPARGASATARLILLSLV